MYSEFLASVQLVEGGRVLRKGSVQLGYGG